MDYTAATPAEKVGYITGSEISIPEIHELHAGPSGKIYMNMIFRNEVKGFVDNSIPAKVLTLKDGKFEDVTGYDVEYINNHKGGLKPPYSIYNIFKVKEDPQDPDAYYVGTFTRAYIISRTINRYINMILRQPDFLIAMSGRV